MWSWENITFFSILGSILFKYIQIRRIVKLQHQYLKLSAEGHLKEASIAADKALAISARWVPHNSEAYCLSKLNKGFSLISTGNLNEAQDLFNELFSSNYSKVPKHQNFEIRCLIGLAQTASAKYRLAD